MALFRSINRRTHMANAHRMNQARAALSCRHALAVVLVGAVLSWSTSWGGNAANKIVLIGGARSEGPAQHDYPNGIRLLKVFLDSSPDAQEIEGLSVDAHPDGWPTDPAALDGAATIVWYFDGLEKHPLLDATHRAQFEALMKEGAGLVALHQATTVPADDKSIELQRWLGGARYGMFDRTTEMVEFKPAVHSVSRGVGAFTYMDEFYPTIRFIDGGRAVAPILTGKLHVQFRDGRHLVIDEPTVSTIAWAFERDNGGRSFGFSGGHYLVALDEPALRRMLLNAIFWTARIDVPKDGVRSGLPDAATRIAEQARRATAVKRTVTEAVVARPAENKVVEYPWGRITWYVSRELGNSDTLTVGQAIIKPGRENPRHYHPNCDEVLHVSKGRILHTMGDRTVEMLEGDTVSIPTGVRHNARNIGTQDAVLAISFSSADRKVVGE